MSDAYAGLNKAAVGKGKNKIQGGLVYRVDRSDTYLQYFNSLLADLSITRVGDFLSYLELGNRRLGDTYGSIATIGARFAALTRKINGYNRELQARELDTQVSAIEGQTKVNTGIQKIGEVLAFGVIVPAAIFDMAIKLIGDKSWEDVGILPRTGVWGGSYFISMSLWVGAKIIMHREKQHENFIGKGWYHAKAVATEKVIPRLRTYGADFGRCAKDKRA